MSIKDDENEHDEEQDNGDSVILDVGGKKHKTYLTTLSKIQASRLARLADKAKSTGKREFYFDRHPDLFAYILNFHRTGKLHVPLNVCGPIWKNELDFWNIDDKDIQKCCWTNYISYEETNTKIDKFENEDRQIRLVALNVPKDAPFFMRLRSKIWRAFQDPYSSKTAKVYAIVSLLIVLLSVSVFVLETLPGYGARTVHTKDSNMTSQDLRHEFDMFNDVSPYDVLQIIDNMCNVFFISEFVVKLFAAPIKLKFLRSPMSVVDLTSLIPYYIAIIIVFAHPNPVEHFEFIRFLLALRVIRIFRIFIVIKHSMALKVLMYTVSASVKELFLLLLVVMIGVLIFASLEYYMEIFSDHVSDFEDIPLTFWWALITMTTIGYGDLVPQTGLGYIVGSMCALSGVLTLALSVPAIVNNFTLYYTHANARRKHKERKRKFNRHNWKGLLDKSKPGNIFKAVQTILPRKEGTTQLNISSNVIPPIEKRLNGLNMDGMDDSSATPVWRPPLSHTDIFTISTKTKGKPGTKEQSSISYLNSSMDGHVKTVSPTTNAKKSIFEDEISVVEIA